MKRLNRVIEGFTTVCFGLMLLANSAGILSWRVWLTLLSLWPLLLIAIGIEIIGKGAKQEWLRVASSLIVLGGLAWVVFVSPVGGLRWGVPWGEHNASYRFEEQEASGVSSAAIDISTPLSVLSVSDMRRGLVSVELEAPYEPGFEVRTRGSSAEITLEADADGPILMPGQGPSADVTLGRGIGDPIEWELSLDTGVTDCEADLSALRLGGVEVDSGVALVDVKLGRPAEGAGDVPVTISSGIVVATIRVPEGTEFLVDSGVGLGGVDVEAAERVDGTWKSSGYDTAEDRFVIRVTGGIGSVDVRYY